ncbi:MAG: aminotransferase class IV [Pseudomonadota bacterium]
MQDFSKGAAWMKGRVIPIDEAVISVTDWGLTHSDITYDVVGVWEGAFFRLDAYLERFEASMAALRLDVGMDLATIRQVLHRMVATSGLHHSYCAMVASRGSPIIPGSRDPRDCANHFYAWNVPYIHVIPTEVAERGAHLKIATARRIPPDSVDPRAKNYHWGDFTRGLFEAKEAGFDTTVLLDHAGNLTEGPGFNIFAVKDSAIITPELGCLEGITRRTVLEIAEDLGLPTAIRALPLAEFIEADEVFTATTGGGPVPVVKVDDRHFSNGAPGPVTQQIRADYWQWMMDPRFREEIAYPA